MYMYIATCIYWKKSRQYLERYVMLHECSTLRGGDVPPPAQSAKLRVIYGLKMSKTSNLDSFYVNKGRTLYMYMHIVCMNGGYSQWG